MNRKRFGNLSLLAICVMVVSVFSMTMPVSHTAAQAPSNPILFVTQVPVPQDFTTIGSVFGNHLSSVVSAPRGGDLWIRYPDGSLRNLTRIAGYGEEGEQGERSIAVRDPAVYWDGTRAIFSMVIGSPTRQFETITSFWQLYEIRGLGPGDTPVITKVRNQPSNYNNVSPQYGSDDRIIFTSDRPRSGEPHLYPQLDEYEEAPTNTGIWSLDPASGDLRLLDHAPSGDFTPIVDSFGRIIFTRWDHLERDQQADSDVLNGETFGTFNYSDESATATRLNSRAEVFPEPRAVRTDLLRGTNLAGHSFNHFFPWMMHQDGTEPETLNHVGRHELFRFIERSITDDPNVREFIGPLPTRANQNPINALLQLKEDPGRPGVYVGIDAPEFETHASGQVVSIAAPPTLNADQMAVTYITDRSTANTSDDPGPEHSGLYRDPLPLANGSIVVVHTPETRADDNIGSRESPRSRYDFRLKTLTRFGSLFRAGAPLTQGIVETVSYFDPDVRVNYSGPLWELHPVEVRARTRPPSGNVPVPLPEREIFADAGVNLATFQDYLRRNNLALLVARNVTTRDRNDFQQPYNLRVAGTSTQTLGSPGKVYDVSTMQLFQADQIRGLTFGNETPRSGRRVLAQPLHDPRARNIVVPGGPPGSVAIGNDGSVAAFVPAQRAMTWALAGPTGEHIVRERFWLTFQPGEIRVCSSCHGLNTADQAGDPMPTNESEALVDLVEYWKSTLAPNPNQDERVFLPAVIR